ncbi:MAG: carboxypeptidase regulatory-like domain-containing protein [Pyrinomonadaceae bacterium]
MKKLFEIIAVLLCVSLLTPGLCVGAVTPLPEITQLTFKYPADDSVRIDLATSSPVYAYTITKTLDRTVIDIPGVTSRLYPAYTVRNSFDVQVDTSAIAFVSRTGLRLTIISPRGTIVEHIDDPAKMSFLVRRPVSTLASGAAAAASAKTRVPTPMAGTKTTPATIPLPQVQNVSYKLAPAPVSTPPKESIEPVRTTTPRSDTGGLRGKVRDQHGAVIVGAVVAIIGPDKVARAVKTDGEGKFAISDLPLGNYSVVVRATHFAEFRADNVEVIRRSARDLDVVLKVNVIQPETVTVAAEEKGLSTDLASNAGSVVLDQHDLSTMPQDPAGFSAALQALAAANGGMGGEIVVDGFPGGRIPPKQAIKEIRISKNTYSAEYSRPGNGRIEIITKPGMEDYSGGGYLGFNDRRLNTRDPFTAPPLPYGSKDYGFYFGGPLIKKRLSFFSNFDRGRSTSSTSVNARVLDGRYNIVPYDRSFISPQHYANITTRFDLQLNDRNTFITKYAYSGNGARNGGFGGTTLPDRVFDSTGSEHLLQFSVTSVLSSNIVTETRSQYVRRDSSRQAPSFGLSIDVPGAFLTGSSFGRIARVTDRLDIHNVTTATFGDHTIRAGGGFRYSDILDSTDQGFGGTYRFDGAIGPVLDASGRVVLNAGQSSMNQLTGIERYRRTLLLASMGRTAAEIRSLGGGASQFSITRGNSDIDIVQRSFYGFAQDEWKLRPNFTLGVGMRVEGQSNVPHGLAIGPRISFAWAKRASGSKEAKRDDRPTLVVRGGTGLFYEPFGEDLTLRADRLNGADTRQYVVTDPVLLDAFPAVPSEASLRGAAVPATTITVDPNLRLPMILQSTMGIEKQLPRKFVLAANFMSIRGRNSLRTRLLDPAARRFQYESTGKFDQRQLSLTLSRRLSSASFYATYNLSSARGDTDGASSVPFDRFNPRLDFGRASSDVRHSVYVGGWIKAFGLDVSPTVVYRSGVPFNITVGRDLNGDTVLNDRPAFATDLSRPSVVVTPFGTFDTDPIAGQQTIPRNYGTSPSFLSVNLNISKAFTLSGDSKPRFASERFLGIPVPKRPIYLTFSVQVENLLNQTNPYLPEGNLSSPLFGRTFYSAGSYGFGSYQPGNRIIKPYINLSF